MGDALMKFALKAGAYGACATTSQRTLTAITVNLSELRRVIESNGDPYDAIRYLEEAELQCRLQSKFLAETIAEEEAR